MAKYFLTNKAVEDLTDIWLYTKDEWSEDQADKYYYYLLDSCQEVADNPNLAKQYEEVNKGLLGIRANRHIIFFRILSKSEIEVIRILHGMMDLKSKMKG
ncbi:MAG: type II toxin-antitoxin system RelE/ParE family toxin [Crocinitomicaceae bacterium]|nr:type II toxin-antitoxin system RelE/ParE family toxin [Crocinitomicaceae bacterium]